MGRRAKAGVGALLGAVFFGLAAAVGLWATFGPIPTGPAGGIAALLFLVIAGPAALIGLLVGGAVGYAWGGITPGGDDPNPR